MKKIIFGKKLESVMPVFPPGNMKIGEIQWGQDAQRKGSPVKGSLGLGLPTGSVRRTERREKGFVKEREIRLKGCRKEVSYLVKGVRCS